MKLGKGLYIVVLGISLWCSLASAQITCTTGYSCQTNSVPVFASNGGNAQVTDSIIQQSGSTVSVGGALSVSGALTTTGLISGSEFEIGGSLFAFGSAANENAFLGFAGPLAADTYPVILHGKVVMQDGSAPPVIMGIERVCSDVAGDRPGTLTDKKGEYIWRMEIDPLETRDCQIRATHVGYHLIGKGRPDLEADVAYRPRLKRRLVRFLLIPSEIAGKGLRTERCPRGMPAENG